MRNDAASTLLTVFFDKRCGLCRSEMDAIGRLDVHRELRFVDCSDAAFDDRAYAAEGVTRAEMMAALHVRDILGDWHRGPDAVGLLYATVGAPLLARLWTHRFTRPLMQRFYPWAARHRYTLSALGLHWVSPWVLRLFARRTHVAQLPHAPVCKHGACDPQWLVRR